MKSKRSLSERLIDAAEKYDDPLLWSCVIEAHELTRQARNKRWDAIRDWTLLAVLVGHAVKFVVVQIWR